MKKLYVFLGALLLVISTWAMAEEFELLDSYLEEVPTGTSTQAMDSGTIVGQPVDIVVDENGQSHEVVRPEAVEYRLIKSADGSEVYEEVPVHSATPVTVPNTVSSTVQSSDVVMNHEVEAYSQQDLEIIELEPEHGEVIVIEAPESQTSQTVATTNSGQQRKAVSGHAFCQQNPYARECLLSKYLVLCKRDPQSSDCKTELYKFDKFCGTFPNAYKCKKANIAAACKQNPGASGCKTFGQRYCQKYPKAIFCNYN